jgi:choline dehydrogenase-like flavoprotein
VSAGPRPPEHHVAYPNVLVGAEIDGDRTLSADVVVVGTGAGGATVAARLRAAGLDVLMLEEGGLHRTETFTTDPIAMVRRLYRDAGTSMILGRPPIIFAEGKCVGGSTVINGGMSWRTPARVLEHWERALGLDETGPAAMEPHFAEAERILHVEPNHEDTYGRNTHLFVEGARALGWPVAQAPRNMRRCVGLNGQLGGARAGGGPGRVHVRCVVVVGAILNGHVRGRSTAGVARRPRGDGAAARSISRAGVRR